MCLHLEARPAWLQRWQIGVSLHLVVFFFFILEPVETRIKSPSKKIHTLFILSRFQQIKTRQ